MKEGRHSLGGLFLYHCWKKCHAVLRTVEGLPHVGLSLLQVFQRNLGFGLGSRFGVVMGFQPVTNSNDFSLLIGWTLMPRSLIACHWTSYVKILLRCSLFR